MLRVLVVDDDPVRSARWARALVARGHEVALAPDGERAIDRFVQEPADVCLISLALPGRDGAATAESIRVAPGGDTCAVVLLPGGVRDVAMIERARVRASAAAVAPLGADADKVADLVETSARARVVAPQPLPKTRVAQEIESGGGSGLGPTRSPSGARGRSTEMFGGHDELPPTLGPGSRGRENVPAILINSGKPTAVVNAASLAPVARAEPRAPAADEAPAPAPAPSRRRETAVLAPPERAGTARPHDDDDDDQSTEIPPTRAGKLRRATAPADDHDHDHDDDDDEQSTAVPPTRKKRSQGTAVAERADEGSARRMAVSAAFTMESASLSVSTALAGIDDPSAQREAQEVERRARAIAKTDDGRTGTLHDVPFPKLLAELGRERVSGALAIVHEDDGRRATGGDTIKKIVFFKAGVPVFVRSNVLAETLGHVLVRMGALTPRQLEMSVDRMRRENGRQGQILVAMGAITPHQLVGALQEQLRQKLFDIFAWSTGTFRFSSKVQAPPDVISLEMGLVEAVFEGIVRKVHPTRVLTRLEPDLERYAVPETRRAERFLSLDLVTEARRVVSAIDGTQKVKDLLAFAGNRPGAGAQVLYAMICVDAVTLASEPERRNKPQMPSGEQRLEAAPEKPFDIETARDVFGRLAVLLRAGKHHEALGLPPDADRDEIEMKIARVMEAHKPELLPPSSPRDLRALAYQVMAQLMEAQQTLLGPGDAPPPAPATAAAPKTPGPLAPMTSGPLSPHGERAGVRGERPRSSRDEDALTRAGDEPAPAAPGGLRGVILAPSADDALTRGRGSGVSPEPLPRTPTGPRGHLPQPPAAAPPPPPPPPPPPSVSVPLPAHSPSFDADVITVTPVRLRRPDAPRAESAPALATPAGPALNDAVERIFEAEHHFRRGESALRRGKYPQAIEAIERAVTLCPEEGEFLAYLGYVRYLAKPTDASVVETAIEDLQRAAMLSPKLDRAHLFLGRVRAAQSDKRQARAAYQKALLANPDCREALEEMRSLEE